MLCFNFDYRELTHAAENKAESKAEIKAENKTENKAENISIPDFLIRNYFKLYSSSKMSICKSKKKVSDERFNFIAKQNLFDFRFCDLIMLLIIVFELIMLLITVFELIILLISVFGSC